MSHNQAVIVDYIRTPFAKAAVPGSGKEPGMYHDIHPVDLTIPLINEMLKRTAINPGQISKLLTGAVHQEAEQGMNIGRLNVLAEQCGLSNRTAGSSVDMFCASSMEAVAMADAFIARNPEDVYICTGVQSMSRVPMGGHNPELPADVYDGNAAGFMNMGKTAENLAEHYDISRKEQDQFALISHQRAHQAQQNNVFEGEILPLYGLDHDDGVRPGSTLEELGKLKPAFKPADRGGTVTPATASQITDGAAAALVTSQAFAEQQGLPIKARILSAGETGLAPDIMGLGPVGASEQALKRAGLCMNDISYVELNEAFAAQSLAVTREWEQRGMAFDFNKLNVHGGAIAIGHPLGTSGARLVGHLANTLQQNNARYGLATLCVGGGQGRAVVLENPNAPRP